MREGPGTPYWGVTTNTAKISNNPQLAVNRTLLDNLTLKTNTSTPNSLPLPSNPTGYLTNKYTTLAYSYSP